MLLDLDQFKQVNDAYGHERGDEALIAVADVLRRQLRDTDLPARFGGDEFAALITGVDLPIARRIAERVARAVAAAWSEPQLGVSIGLAVPIAIADERSRPPTTTCMKPKPSPTRDRASAGNAPSRSRSGWPPPASPTGR